MMMSYSSSTVNGATLLASTESADAISLEDALKCPICLDIFTDPVSLTCGHTYCKGCTDSLWEGTTIYMCPECRRVFPKKPIPCKNIVIACLVDRHRENISKRQVVLKLPTFQEARTNALKQFTRFKEQRGLTIGLLQEKVDLLKARQRNVNLTRLSGSSIGVVGGVLSIVGLALMPVTFGVSIGLTIAGAATGIAGGLTAVGASIVHQFLNRMSGAEANKLIGEDARCAAELHELMVELNIVTGGTDHASHILPLVAKSASQIGFTVASLVDDVAIGALRGTAAAALRVTGIVLSSVFLVVDVYGVVTSSIDLAKSSPSMLADELQKAIDMLANQLVELTTLYDKL